MEPEETLDIQDIRNEIDKIDRKIIELLGKRFEYVKAAAKFKTSEESVKAPERRQAMMQQRRVWAEEQGLNPNVIEKLYQDLVTYFMNEELHHWKSRNK